MRAVGLWFALLGVAFVIGGWTDMPPTPAERDVLMRLPAPVSQADAEAKARAFITDQLPFPGGARFTFFKPVRAMLYAGGKGRPPLPGVYLCGDVAARDGTGTSVRHFMFQVLFDPTAPGEISDGFIAAGNRMFVVDWCADVYQRGVPVFPSTP